MLAELPRVRTGRDDAWRDAHDVERADWIPKSGFDAPATHPKAAPLAEALEEQLGLKLEPIRVPQEFIVVDRVVQPRPN